MLLGPLDIVILFSAMATSPTAVPEPQPTELREIGHVQTTAFCKTFEQLVVPLTLIARHNENAFVSLEAPVARFRGGEGFAANGAAIHDALTQGSSSLQTVESSAVANADPMASDEDDDDDTYTPERTLAAANIDRIVMQIRHDLVLADKVMDQSWKAVPGHGDPKVNALRQRMQNIIDLQRALANRFEDVSGTYFSNYGNAKLGAKAERASYKSLLDQMLDAQIAEDQVAANVLSAETLPAPAGDLSGVKWKSAGEVAASLRSEEVALSVEGPSARRSCVEPPSVAPTP